MNDQHSADIAALREEVRELSEQIHGLVEAWNTARGVVKFVKWLSSMAIAVTSIWALFRMGSVK